MSAYGRGREAEYRVRDRLRDDGYFVVKSGGSKTPVDLVAIKPGQVLFVQVKRGTGGLRPPEWNTLYELAESCGAVAVLAEVPLRRPVCYWRLSGRKNVGKHRASQPMTPFVTDEIASAS